MSVTEQEAERYPWLVPEGTWYGAEEIPEGWKSIILIMCENIRDILHQYKIPFEKYHLDQGKEKWGELCWYDRFDEDIPNSIFIRQYIKEHVIDHYRQVLKFTCKFCGKPGKIRGGSWISVKCDECAQ